MKNYSTVLLDFDSIMLFLKYQNQIKKTECGIKIRDEVYNVKENNIDVIGLSSSNYYFKVQEFLNYYNLYESIIETPNIKSLSLNHIYFYNLLHKLITDTEKMLVVSGSTQVIEAAKVLDLDCCYYEPFKVDTFNLEGVLHIDSLTDLVKNKVKTIGSNN